MVRGGGAVMEQPTRPVLRWHGGKWRLAPWIISHFPPHKVYCEPYGGAASVLLRKPRAITEIYNDLDRLLVQMFEILRERPLELARAIAMTPYARDEYVQLYQPSPDPLEQTRRFIARSFMGMFSKGAITQSGFDARVNPDGYTGRLRSFFELPDEVMKVAERFRHVIIENVDALKLICRIDRPDALIYVDPPYMPEVRAAKAKVYEHEMDVAAHEALLKALAQSRSMVIVSGYSTDLYADLLAGWRKVQQSARTDGGHIRSEALWLNPVCCEGLPIQDGSPSAIVRRPGRSAARVRPS